MPLRAGHRLHVIYRMAADDGGVDYVIHHPHRHQPELLAQDDGHFMGPALSWPELVGAADNALPRGSTTDPHARLLLLLPAFGDDALPGTALHRLAAALRVRTAVEDSESLASALLRHQGPPGPVHWATGKHGLRALSVNDGGLSFRNPVPPTTSRCRQIASPR